MRTLRADSDMKRDRLCKISLIITTYNRPHLLPRAVRSAQQSASDIEVIVVDDGSVDETGDVCRKLEGIKYVRSEKNFGVAGARNLGLMESSGEYITFLDDDDVRLPGSLDHQLAVLEAHPSAGMIYGKVFFGDEECHPKGGFYPENCPQGDIFWDILQTNFIPCQSVLFRRECLSRTGLLDETVAGVDDWDLWVRMAEIYSILAIEEPVAVWRQPTAASNQMSQNSEKLHHLTKRLHRDKWLQLPRALEATDTQRREITRRFAESTALQFIWEGLFRLKARRFRDFVRVTVEMLRMYPLTSIKMFFSKPLRQVFIAFLQKHRTKEVK
jgi:GT2 family glycosyltransferase